jgi:hypothetical protein
MVCIVSLIIALIFFWWFTGKPYTKENFATPMPYIVLVGLTTGGDVYYADIDVPMNPKWIKTLSGIGDIAGSYGQLYTVTTGGSIPKYGPYDSTTQTAMAGGTVTKISVDDTNAVVGLNGQDYRYSSSPTGTLAAVSGQMMSVAVNGGLGYWVGSNGTLQYSSAPATNSWVATNTTPEWKQVSFDSGIVCALKTAGGLWTADKNVATETANWTQQGTQLFNQICIKAGRLVGVGTDGIVYYSNSYSSPSWTRVPTQTYTTAGATTTPSSLSFSKVILMYPRLDARRKRFLGSATSCNSNEQLIGNFCYQSCPSGMPSKGTSCPYRAKYINAIASCPTGEYIRGSCYQACPTGSVDPNNREMCLGTPTNKDPPIAQTPVTPSTNTCPTDGSITGRYIRVRPTTLISNNKLCISSIIVKDGTGTTISTNANAKVTATDTKDAITNDCPIGRSTCPLLGVYLSGTKYDRDTDGGKLNRINNLYWELDLGSMMNISEIRFVGCDYVPSGTVAATTSGTNTGIPDSDQITGMTIEVLGMANHATSAPITSRSLGPDMTQTIKFNYKNKFTGDNTCYDDCPKINGMTSVLDPVNNLCIASKGGVTNRSVTVPIDVGPVSITTPLNGVGSPLGIPSIGATGTAVNYVNWVTDPADSRYLLSCDNLPGSLLKDVSTTLQMPQVDNSDTLYRNIYGADRSIISRRESSVASIEITTENGTTNDFGRFSTTGLNNPGPSSLNSIWIDSSTNARYAVSRPSNLVCVVPGQVTCPINFIYNDRINTCTLDTNINSVFNFVVRGPATCAQYFYGYTTRVDALGYCWVNYGAGEMNKGREADLYKRNNEYNENNGIYTRTLNKHSTYVLLGRSDLTYANPIVTKDISITTPARVMGTETCLNSDRTRNNQAFAYNGRCMKCPSPNSVFYPKGSTNLVSWSQEIPGKALLGFTSYGSTSFYSVDDAKQLCEAISDCNGVSGTPGNYTLRAGSNPQNLGSTSFDPPNTSSWKKTTTGNAIITHGKYKNKTATTMNIPRAFADDYVGPAAASKPASSTTSGILAMYNTAAGALGNMMASLGAAAAFDLYANSVQNSSDYYTIVGLERQISDVTTSGSGSTSGGVIDYGVCIGPCDSQHPIHDPIQLYKSVEDKIISLYGTTCHEASQITIDQPSISPIYTPQIGSNCPTGYILSGTQCIKECPYGTGDSGSQCTGNSGKRPSTVARYVCPEGTNLLDTVCVYPCESGHVPDGEYCQPPQQITSLGSSNSIKCTKAAYGYSQGSGSGTLSKWLCDSQEDLDALIGFSGSSSTGGTSYVNQNDIVCAADDPTTGMYYCQSVSDAINQVANSERTDIQSTCNNLVKAYYDLSNNLDILASASTSAKNASQKVAAIQMTLQSIRDSQCIGASGSSSLCNSLNTQINALNTNINSGSGAIANVSTPIQIAVASRENLIAKMNQFQCTY